MGYDSRTPKPGRIELPGKMSHLNTARHINRIAWHGTVQYSTAHAHTWRSRRQSSHTHTRHVMRCHPVVSASADHRRIRERTGELSRGVARYTDRPVPPPIAECVRCVSVGLRLVLWRSPVGGGWRGGSVVAREGGGVKAVVSGGVTHVAFAVHLRPCLLAVARQSRCECGLSG